MPDDVLERHEGDNHVGPGHSSPYPVSRLAPAIDLVDTARQIAEADQRIGTAVHGKLEVIARQIRALQDQAREILEQAADSTRLHRAECNFQKRVGQVYHLYERPDGSSYFSMLSPQDWSGKAPHAHGGAYRLEPDLSWTPAEAAPAPSLPELRAAVGLDGSGSNR